MHKQKKQKWIVRSSGRGSLISQIKESRNLPDSFFSKETVFPDPDLMKDMQRASHKIIEMLNENKTICIFGHDDIDGITSTYLVYDYLLKCGYKRIIPYIPNRFTDHHGIQESFINFAAESNIDLVVTVDGCISSLEGIAKLKENGVEVIVTDHHIVPEKLPEAYAIVNPKQSDCPFPYDMLAGAGVAYFLILSLKKITGRDLEKSYKTWAALGTIADRVPLRDLNHIIARDAFLNLADLQDDTLKFLSKDWHLDSYTSRADFLRYTIKLLSLGRDSLGKHKAFQLMISEGSLKHKYYQSLREELQENCDKIDNLYSCLGELIISPDSGFFFYFNENDEIAPELLGMAASQITQKYRIAAFFVQRKNDDIVCEARGHDNINLVDIFKSISDLLTQYGGHKKAAGFSAPYKNLQHIEKAITAYFLNNRIETFEDDTLYIDAVLESSEISDSLFAESSVLYPFGQDNPEPIVLIKNYKTSQFPVSGVNLNDLPEICDILVFLNYDSFFFIDFK